MFDFFVQSLLGFVLWLNNFFQDFGLTIIVFTLILKIVLSPIEFLVFIEEDKIRKIRPKISEILKNNKTDFQKQAELLNQVYKEANYNPFFTMVIQFLPLPIFLGIFFTLQSLLQSSGQNLFFLETINLAQKNTFLILSVALLQFLSLLQLPKEQRSFALLFFGFILVILFQFPAIFSLYWLVNIILTFIEKLAFNRFNQFLLNRILHQDDSKK
jgi:YidC/Oxa1 family membrane protein insertase